MFKLYHNEQHIDGLLEEVKGKQKELDRLVSEVDTLASTQDPGWSVVHKCVSTFCNVRVAYMA